MTCQSTESSDAVQSDRRAGGCRSVETDESRIASALKDLRTAGWYWGGLTASEAQEVLRDASEGTFLVRDSSQSDFLFTISAVTAAGPTNLRIQFRHGKFKLDSVVLVKPRLKQFDGVVRLVEHYVRLSRRSGVRADPADPGTPNGAVPLLLTRPAYTDTPPLQHLCRIAINRRTRRVLDPQVLDPQDLDPQDLDPQDLDPQDLDPRIQDLPLPSRLKDYLTDYSYDV